MKKTEPIALWKILVLGIAGVTCEEERKNIIVLRDEEKDNRGSLVIKRSEAGYALNYSITAFICRAVGITGVSMHEVSAKDGNYLYIEFCCDEEMKLLLSGREASVRKALKDFSSVEVMDFADWMDLENGKD